MIYLLSVFVLAALLVLASLLLSWAEAWLVDDSPVAVEINGGERRFEVRGGSTIMTALWDEEIFLPSACGGRGTCGHCKLRVLEGGGPVLPTELPFLDRAERLAGWRLACQVKAHGKLRLEIPEALLHVSRYRLRLLEGETLPGALRRLRLAVTDDEGMVFRPGQYLQVERPGEGEAIIRAYSFASAPETSGGTGELEILVKRVPGGRCSPWLHELPVGGELVVTGPYGDFRLDENDAVGLVAVAGGCGLAPLRSLVQAEALRHPHRPMELYFGVDSPEELFLVDELKALERGTPGLRLHLAASRVTGPGPWEGERGHVHLAVDRHFSGKGDWQAFLCGPPPMVDAVAAVLVEKGLPPGRIYHEAY